MNLLIGFVILLCLACSEFQAAEAAQDVWTRVIFVALISLMVPGLALFQTLVVTKKIRNSDLGASAHQRKQEKLVHRLSVCHSAVWLAASLAIIWSVRWQDVVRGNWNLDQWPLLDEALILAPVIFSLVASWAIFYEIQTAIKSQQSTASQDNSTAATTKPSNQHKQSRLAFVSIRFRVYFLIVLIPISIAVLAKDISPWIETLAAANQFGIYFLATLSLLAGFPFLLLLIWKNQPIANQDLRSKLLATCGQHKIHVHDIRIWNTQGQVVNALVAGMLPKLRIILLSDALVRHFPKNELLAIVRHEAAHLRLWHLPTRIGFAILPLLALAIDERNPTGVINFLNELMTNLGFVQSSGVGLILAGYLSYLFLGFTWISHQIEHEADIYACQAIRIEPVEKAEDSTIEECPQLAPTNSQFEYAQDVMDALLRLGAFAPDQFEKSSLLHPSVGSRIRLIQDLKSDSEKAELFRRSFSQRRKIVFGALVMVCLMAFIARLTG